MFVLDLFAGIGGFSLGLTRAGMTTVAFCEIEPFCQKVLKKHWPDVPIFNDIKTLHKETLIEAGVINNERTIDVLAGGPPCQPFSSAGLKRGTADSRSLWPEMLRVIKEIRPTWIIFENVIGIIGVQIPRVLTDLESEGYDFPRDIRGNPIVFNIPSCALGAPYPRYRTFIIARTLQQGRQHLDIQPQQEISSRKKPGEFSEARITVDADDMRELQPQRSIEALRGRLGDCTWWSVEPDVARVVSRISRGMDRLKRIAALGNSVNPQIPEIFGRMIMQIEQEVPNSET